jgi:O-antigen/teichoic acid export membrane protein
MPSSSNKRIAKNTLFLYCRMLLTMGVSLYTSRVVLNTLGVSDFGLYNVVGGIVVLFVFLNNALGSGTSQFLTFDLGKKDYVQFKKTFSMAISLHIALAIVILIVAETIGLWFLNTQLVIPTERILAANWVYQFSVLSCMIQITQVPYNAAIIAHERMNVYAYVSIIDVLLKLFIVFILTWVHSYDKLCLYALLILGTSFITAMIYRIYCTKQFTECHYQFEKDKTLFKKLLSFCGWDLFGGLCVVTQGEGINMLLNIFFGTIVNAARGVTFQVQNALSAFTSNFMIAVQPQIVKLYAENNLEKMMKLVFNASKYSFFLLWFLSLPIILETHFILEIWLKTVPEHTFIFLQIVLFTNLIRTFARPIIMAVHASGFIKHLNLYAGGVGLLPLPICYVILKIGFKPEAVFIVVFLFSIFANITELFILKNRISFSIKTYIYTINIKCLFIALCSFILPFLLRVTMHEGFARFLLVGFSSVITVGLSVFFFGINKEIRVKVKDIVSLKLGKVR